MDLNSRSPVGSDLAGIVSVLTSVADLNSRSPVGSDFAHAALAQTPKI